MTEKVKLSPGDAVEYRNGTIKKVVNDGNYINFANRVHKSIAESDYKTGHLAKVYFAESSMILQRSAEQMTEKHRVYDDRTNETIHTADSASECTMFILTVIGENSPDFEHIFVEEVESNATTHN